MTKTAGMQLGSNPTITMHALLPLLQGHWDENTVTPPTVSMSSDGTLTVLAPGWDQGCCLAEVRSLPDAAGWECRVWLTEQRTNDVGGNTLALLVASETSEPDTITIVTPTSLHDRVSDIYFFGPPGDDETLLMYCIIEVMERTRAEHETSDIKAEYPEVSFLHYFDSAAYNEASGFVNGYGFQIRMFGSSVAMEAHKYPRTDKVLLRGELDFTHKEDWLFLDPANAAVLEVFTASGRDYWGMTREEFAVIFRTIYKRMHIVKK